MTMNCSCDFTKRHSVDNVDREILKPPSQATIPGLIHAAAPLSKRPVVMPPKRRLAALLLLRSGRSLRMSMTFTEQAARTEAVWREFHKRLHAFISGRVQSASEADDIVQEVFVRIHKNIAKIQNEDRMAAWIFQITRNAITDQYRARSGAESLEPDFEPPMPQNDGSNLRELAELSGCIEPMLGALPDRYRDALKLTDLGGMGQREAAERSHISVSGMKSRVQRGRLQLKELILQCCQVELNHQGRIVDYSVRESGNCHFSHQSETLRSRNPCDRRCGA